MKNTDRNSVESGSRLFVSIVVPVFNYGHYLGEAVESVLRQPGSWELLVLDDGSTDDTPDVAKKLQQKFGTAFRYLRQENRGVAAARNRAVDETSGDYVLFLDADDYLCPDILGETEDTVRAAGRPAMIICDYLIDTNGRDRRRNNKSLSPSLEGRLRQFLFKKNLSITPSATLIRRDVFEHFRFPEDVDSSEDIPFFAGILGHFRDVALFRKPICTTRRHSSSRRRDLERADRAFEELNRELVAALPHGLKGWARQIEAGRYLSLFRLSYRAGDYRRARHYYRRAMKAHLWSVFRFSYLGKYLRSLARS